MKKIINLINLKKRQLEQIQSHIDSEKITSEDYYKHKVKLSIEIKALDVELLQYAKNQYRFIKSKKQTREFD